MRRWDATVWWGGFHWHRWRGAADARPGKTILSMNNTWAISPFGFYVASQTDLSRAFVGSYFQFSGQCMKDWVIMNHNVYLRRWLLSDLVRTLVHFLFSFPTLKRHPYCLYANQLSPKLQLLHGVLSLQWSIPIKSGQRKEKRWIGDKVIEECGERRLGRVVQWKLTKVKQQLNLLQR